MTTTGRVLVTGANGRIGRRVVVHLATKTEFDVVRVVSPRSADVRARRLDIADSEATDQLIAQISPDVIIHLAGALPATGSNFSINESSTRAIVEASNRIGVSRIVLASSAAVYGDSRLGALKESLEPRPTGPYGESKVASEEALAAADCETIALRIFNVYGPGFDDSLIERLIASGEDSPVPIGDLDEFVRDYIQIEDVAEAIVAAATVVLPDLNNVINVGTGVPINNRELLRILSAQRDIYFTGGMGGASHSLADVSREREVLKVGEPRLLADIATARRADPMRRSQNQ